MLCLLFPKKLLGDTPAPGRWGTETLLPSGERRAPAHSKWLKFCHTIPLKVVSKPSIGPKIKAGCRFKPQEESAIFRI
jgi:hypothetical protein